jgi:hypothetical protein
MDMKSGSLVARRVRYVEPPLLLLRDMKTFCGELTLTTGLSTDALEAQFCICQSLFHFVVLR